MIPKIIHYCWFGRNEKSEFIRKCIQSWKIYLPDYEIVEWNEDNFDIETSFFTEEAYAKKKWAFVSDYVRAHALYHIGGIYLDTDVEIRHSLNKFLHHGAFSGFEDCGYPFTALWGSRKEHNWPKDIINYYDHLNRFNDKTNTKIVSEYLINRYKVNPHKNEIQNLDDQICIYPSNYFCLNIEQNYAVHHFQGSWIEGDNHNYNPKLLKLYYRDKFLHFYSKDKIIEKLYEEKWFTIKDLIFFILKKVKNKYIVS